MEVQVHAFHLISQEAATHLVKKKDAGTMPIVPVSNSKAL